MKTTDVPFVQPWPVLGNERVQEFLQTSIAANRCASAYLFTGPVGVGKGTVALHFVQSVLCHEPVRGTACGHCVSCSAWQRRAHPDAVLFDPDTFVAEDDQEKSATGAILIGRVREVLQKLHYRPALGTYRVALINHADRLVVQAANALLKTLEEPQPNTVMVLTAVSRTALPLTLRSRCQELAFHMVDQRVIEQKLESLLDDADAIRNIAACAAGRPGIALTFAQQPQLFAAYREQVEKLLAIIEAPLPQRMALVSSLIRPQRRERVTRQAVQELLGRWRGLFIDMVLLCKRVEGHLVHRFAAQRLQTLADRHGAQHCAAFLIHLETARRRIINNVNPQLVFDDLVLHW